MNGGGSSTPKETAEEKMLAQMAQKKYNMASMLTQGSDYLTKDATVDRSNRYTEDALASTAEALAQTKYNPNNYATGTADLRVGISAANAGKAQADKESAAKINDVVQSSLGTVGSTSAALEGEGRRKMAVEQAAAEAKQAQQAAVIGAVGSVAGMAASKYGSSSSSTSDTSLSASEMLDRVKSKTKSAYYGDRNPNSPYFRGSI